MGLFMITARRVLASHVLTPRTGISLEPRCEFPVKVLHLIAPHLTVSRHDPPPKRSDGSITKSFVAYRMNLPIVKIIRIACTLIILFSKHTLLSDGTIASMLHTEKPSFCFVNRRPVVRERRHLASAGGERTKLLQGCIVFTLAAQLAHG
jgi:hypothetical protein